MTTIVFYGRNGAAAKERAKSLRKGRGRVVIYDVTAWGGTKDGADEAVVMDCVSYFDRQRIEHVFGKPDAESIGANEEVVDFRSDDEKELTKKLIEEKGDIRIPKKRGRKPKAKAAV